MRYLKFLLPRVSLLAVLCLGLWVSSALLARYAVNQTENTLSHAIGTDEVEFDWQNSSMSLSNVTVGTPDDDPMYLEMDKLTLQLDPKAIVSRRLVVRDGVITNLHLADSRLESHENQTEGQDASVFSGNTQLVRQTLSDKLGEAVRNAQPSGIEYQSAGVGSTWWQSIKPMLAPTAGDTSLTQNTDQFRAKWQSKIEDCRKRGLIAQQKIAAIKRESSKPTNPLRAHGQTLETQQKLSELTATVIDLQAEMQELHRQAAAELQAMAKNRKGQLQAMEAAATLPQPSPALLTSKVVSNQQLEQVQAMMKWVDWSGNLIPNLEINPKAVRGRNVSFGKVNAPALQVDQLTLVGVTDVGGAYYRFMGRLNNFTNAPTSQFEPTSLSLRAQGPQHVIVNAVYDRRKDGNKTTINIKTPDLIQEKTYLPPVEQANALGLGISISPTTAYSQICLTLEDDKISGQVTVRHSNAEIMLTDGQIQDPTLVGLINYELSEFDQYETVYQLGGTIDQVVATPTTDLGSKIATAFHNATKSHVAKMLDLQNVRQQSLAKQQIESLSGWLHNQTNDVFALIQSNRTQIASAEGVIENNLGQSLRLR